MRSFELLAFRHVILFIIPTLVFIILLWVGFKSMHFKSKDSEERKKKPQGSTISGDYGY